MSNYKDYSTADINPRERYSFGNIEKKFGIPRSTLQKWRNQNPPRLIVSRDNPSQTMGMHLLAAIDNNRVSH